MYELFRKKRSEDLKTVFEFISSHFKFESFTEKGTPFINASWFVIEIPETQDENFKKLFVSKAERFMKNLIERIYLIPSFLVIAEKKAISEKAGELLSAVLLTSPKGKIFFFLSDEKLLPDFLKIQQDKKTRIGQSEIYLFEELITTLNEPEKKKHFFKILKNIRNF